MSREFLMIVEESSFKTPAASPTVWTTSTTYGLANAQAYYVRLGDGNSFTMRPQPVQKTIMYGGGLATPRNQISDKQACTGKLTLKLCASTAPFFLSWAGVTVNSGGTTPWSYSGTTAGDLPSCAVYHGIERSADFSIKRRVYLGTKVAAFDLATSEDSTDVTLTLDLIASTPQGNQFDSSSDPNSTVFPAPADDNFPSDFLEFIHGGGSGFVTYQGAARTQFTDLHIRCQNALSTRYFANRYPQMIRHMGRNMKVSTKLLYPPVGQDDRTAYEGLTAGSTSIELNNGTHGFTLTANAQNVMSSFEDDLPLAEFYTQASSGQNLWDPVAGADFSLAFA